MAEPKIDRSRQKPPLSDAARRALAEAEARRAIAAQALPPERGGPAGPEPTRYGDWERKGIAVDF
jgi:hypothetical protein